jgi:molybdenum cofactor cytidylyltransferase
MPRHFALIPAAGHSTRMGAPKLLLPLAGQPLILHTISAWHRSKVDRIIIVIRPGDEALAAAVNSADLDIVIPATPPPDMKASIQTALLHIELGYRPTDDDAFLVAPADMPSLSTPIINRLIDQHAASPSHQILAPSLHGVRGHPVLFPWSLAAQVHSLPNTAGLDSLVYRQPPRLVPCEDLAAGNEYPFADIDTPEQFRRLANGL